MMKTIWTYSIIFSFFFCYAQDNKQEKKKGKNEWLIGDLMFGNTMVYKDKKYMSNGSYWGGMIRNHIYLHNSDINENISYFITTQLSFIFYHNDYYLNGNQNFLLNLVSEVPVLFTSKLTKGNFSVYASLGLYGSIQTIYIDGNQQSSERGTFSGYGFGIMLHTELDVKIDYLNFRIGFPLRLELQRYKNDIITLPLFGISMGWGGIK